MKIIKYLIMFDKKEHQITAREKIFSEVVYLILFSVISNHWRLIHGYSFLLNGNSSKTAIWLFEFGRLGQHRKIYPTTRNVDSVIMDGTFHDKKLVNDNCNVVKCEHFAENNE